MPVVVKTFATPAEASSALASDRSARFIGGGTLVMRALNEGDVGISTIVRLEERALSQIRTMGARDIALEEFLAGRDRATGAIVLGVSCDRPPNPEAFRYRKVARVKPKGVSVLSIAAIVPAVGGRVSRARIAYGAMAPTAIRAKAAERALEGRTLDESGVAAAVAAAAEGTSPATDAIASAWYRREVVGVHLRRLLLGRNA
jgi:CO/xanthine dehydrogenase FAD-binding subunit